MKITIKKTIEETHELELPAYRKDGICHWYKIISEREAVQVCNGKYVGVEICVISPNNALDRGTLECTSLEFELNLSEVINILKTKALI
jgi:hypothetical protein